jgi:hypothetical protein
VACAATENLQRPERWQIPANPRRTQIVTVVPRSARSAHRRRYLAQWLARLSP